MNLTELWTIVIPEYLHLVLPLTGLFGLLLGLIIGRRSGMKRGQQAAAVSTDDGSVSIKQAFEEAVSESSAHTAVDESPDTDGDISSLVGMSNRQAQALQGAGIDSIASLVAATESKKQRESLADQLQLEDFVVNKWARMAALTQLPGLTPELAEFLVYFGINSPQDLASRNAESMAHKMHNLNQQENRIAQSPTRQQLEAWITQVQETSD